MDLGLRFDLTVPLARYYAKNHAGCRIRSRPCSRPGVAGRAAQKGRYRQFTQCDIDILGVASVVAEIELILATTEALARARARGPDGADQRPAHPGRHGPWCGFAPERHESVFIALDKWDKLGRPRSARSWSRPGIRRRPSARMLELYGRAGSERAWPGCGTGWPASATTEAIAAWRASSTTSGRRRATVRSSSTRRWCGACRTTRGRSSRSVVRLRRPPSPAAGATTTDRKLLGQRRYPRPGSPSGSSGSWTILGEAARPGARQERVALLFDEGPGRLA